MASVMSDPTTLNLISLRISNGASIVKGKPTRLKVLNWGDNETKKGVVRVGQKTVDQLPALQKQFNFDRVALDYEHNTVPGSAEYERTKEPREVAAYGTPLIVPGDGLYLVDLTYTPSGDKNALEFIDLSPCVHTDESGEVLFMHSTALCRQGATIDLSYYSIEINKNEKEHGMDPKEIVSKLTLLTGTVDEQKTQIGELLALSQTVKTQDATIVALTDRLDKFERQGLVDKAASAGKVIPLKADQLASIDLTTLSAMIDNLPATVPLDRRTPRESVELSLDVSCQEDATRAAKIGGRAKELMASGTPFIVAFSMAEKEFPRASDKK